MDIKASRTYIRMSPRKLREVADLVRGKDARWALASLQFVRRRAAEPIGLVLRQAIANATQVGTNGKLIISKLLIEEGPVAKRFRAISRGQAHPIQKYSSHIRMELKVVAPKVTPLVNKPVKAETSLESANKKSKNIKVEKVNEVNTNVKSKSNKK